MHHTDMLKVGHEAVTSTVEGLTEAQWNTPNVLGHWSPKQIVAHLICYEEVAEGVLKTLLGRDNTRMKTLLRQMDELPDNFNDTFVKPYEAMTGEAVLAELNVVNARNLKLLQALSPEKLREPDTLEWYRPGYAAEDFLIFVNFGHKREHAAQLAQFRATLNTG